MPRSAIDATRFTPTTPHASAKAPSRPGSAFSSPPSSSTAASNSPSPNRRPGPPGETPQQKIRRLREAAALAKNEKISGFDKLIVRGRVWADRAHRFTALSLIALTGISGVITVYALGDMMIYNRRKRREYFAQQEALRIAAVFEARTALRHGTASEEQRALVESEDAEIRAMEAREEQKARAAKEGVWARAKEWLFEGMKRDDRPDEAGPVMEGENGHLAGREERVRLAAAGMGAATGEKSEGVSEVGLDSAILRAVEERNAEINGKIEGAEGREEEGERVGGMLDRLGTPAADSSSETPKKGGSWMAFMSRRQ